MTAISFGKAVRVTESDIQDEDEEPKAVQETGDASNEKVESSITPRKIQKGQIPKEISVTLPLHPSSQSPETELNVSLWTRFFHSPAFVFMLQDTKKTIFIHQSRSHKFFPFHPHSIFIQVWNSIVKCTILLFCIVLPTCLSMPSAQGLLSGLYIGFVMINSIHIFIRCNTGSILNRTLEMSATRTRRNYFSSFHFFSDAFICIPWVFIADAISTRQISTQLYNAPARLLCLLSGWSFISLFLWSKENQVCFLTDRFRMFIRFYNIKGAFVSMAMIICSMILYWHWAACGTLYTAYVGIEPSYVNSSEATTPMNMYSKAFFSVVSEMLSAGWAVAPPLFLDNTLYIWLRILNIFICASFLAVFVGTIASIMHSLDSSGRQYQEKLEEVTQYTKYKAFDGDLKEKILSYFDFKYTGGKFFDEVKIKDELSLPLKQLIAIHDCESLIVKVPFFATADPLFIAQVVVILKPAYFLPGDTIIREGTDGDEMFFIASGSVEVIVGGVVRATLVDGQFFGEIAVVMGKMKRTANIRALSKCRVYSLSRSDLNSILEDHPTIKEKLESIAKERIAANERAARLGSPPVISSIPSKPEKNKRKWLKRPSFASSVPVLFTRGSSMSLGSINTNQNQDTGGKQFNFPLSPPKKLLPKDKKVSVTILEDVIGDE